MVRLPERSWDSSRPAIEIRPLRTSTAEPAQGTLRSMEAGRILVAIGDSSLARVLALWLADALSGDTVLVTPSDCEPPAAADLVARGSHPVVLVPVARAQEYERYHKAGAS